MLEKNSVSKVTPRSFTLGKMYWDVRLCLYEELFVGFTNIQNTLILLSSKFLNMQLSTTFVCKYLFEFVCAFPLIMCVAVG